VIEDLWYENTVSYSLDLETFTGRYHITRGDDAVGVYNLSTPQESVWPE